MSLSTEQKAQSRTEKQFSRLGLAVLQPVTVFACQINDTFDTTDMVTEFDFDNVTTGAYTDVIPGQTYFVGSAPGLYDKGIGRVRKALTSSVFYVGEVSEIAFANNLYITVIDAFDIRAKHLVVTEDEVFVDVDVDYTDQHDNFDPHPTVGGQVVLDVASYPAQVSFPDVADSWVFDSTITAYLFTASEGVVTNETTSNPTLTVSSYPANGYIRVKSTVTAANGKSYSGYRYVFVFDADHRPITNFTHESCSCEREQGAWQARVTLNDPADIALMRPGGLAVLFSKDYYNGAAGVVGLYPGRENVWVSGWIGEYTAVEDPEHAPQSFEIQNAGYWMRRIASFVTGVELATATATAWTEMEGLTVDKGLFHFLHYRTTVTQVMDVYLSGDDKYSPACESPASNIWTQITDIAQSQILAVPRCNNNGKLYFLVPYNLIPSADRAASSELVMDLGGGDYTKTTDIRRSLGRISQVLLNGVVVDVYGNHTALFSLSPGHVPAHIGDVEPVQNLLLASQDQANKLCGLVFAAHNNPYESIPLTLKGNNRAFDIAPHLIATVSMDEYSGVVIPVSINLGYSHPDGKVTVEVVFEGATDETDAIYIDGDIPDGYGGFVPIGGLKPLPPIKPIDIPPIPDLGFPVTPPTQVTTDCGSVTLNFFPLIWSKPFLDGTDSTKLISKAYFPCKIRSNPLTPTSIDVIGKWDGDAPQNWALYGVLGGVRVIQASVTQGIVNNFATFSPVSDTTVDGFEIELTAGFGTTVTQIAAGAVISSGTVQANNGSGVNIAVTPNGKYCIDGSGGPWKAGAAFANDFYIFMLDGSGSVGWADTAFTLTLPSIGVYAEQISSLYGRVYFVANDADINFRAADSPGQYADNTGSLDYILRSATIIGRAISLYQSTLNNVCVA